MIKCEKYLNINVSQHTEFIYKHKITNRNIGKYIIQKMKYQSQYHFADIQYCSYKSFSFKYDALLATKYISYKSLYHSILQEKNVSSSMVFKNPSIWKKLQSLKEAKFSNPYSAPFSPPMLAAKFVV